MLLSICNSVSITSCINKLTESVWGAPLELHWLISSLGFRKQAYSKSPCCCSTNGMLMTLSWFSPPGQKVNACSTQPIQQWHSPANLNTTDYLFLMSLLNAPILEYRLWSTINPCFLDHTHGGGSFCSLWRKMNLIKSLVYHALMSCSKAKLFDKFNFIKTTLLKNGYPKDIITSTIKQ